MTPAERVAAALFALAIRAFPGDFRQLYGAEMIAMFRQTYRDSSPGGALRYTFLSLADAVSTGVAERWRRPAGIPNPPRIPMDTLWQDLRYGVRTLLRSPGFTLVAVLTLGLGIGANASIFSVINAVLLRPLPFREPERLVGVWESRLDRGWTESSFTHANFWDVRDLNRTFEGMAASGNGTINLTGSGVPERLQLAFVSADFFRVLGVDPVLGRTFSTEEDRPGADRHLVILSHGFWSGRMNRDLGIVGRSLTLNGEGYLVIGVLPQGEPWLNEADVFVPFIRRLDANRGSFELSVIGRLKPEITIDAANADLKAVAEQLAQRFPEPNRGMGIVLVPSSRWVASDSLRRALWILMGAVGFLLLIACVNLANLFLARGSGRTRERALRAALGASRGRIIRQVLTESLLVSLTGAAAGLVMAMGTLRTLKALAPDGIPRLTEAGINLWVLGFTAATTLIAALVSGVFPSLQASHADLLSTLREGERHVGGGRLLGRLRGLLVAVEVAAALALLIGAGLLLRSFGEVLGVDRGFETEDRALVQVALPDSYGARTTQFIAQVTERLQSRSEVQSVAAVSRLPFRGVGVGMGFAASDKPAPPGNEVPWASWRIITGGYFRTMGIPLLRGRDFTEQDLISKPWRVIISRRVAEQLWPGEDAVGRQLILWKGQSDDPAEVIGVAGDMREWGLAEEPALTVYLPYYGAGASPVNFVVHSELTVAELGGLVRSTVDGLDSSVPLSRLESLEGLVGESVASRRFIMLLLGTFAVVALMLALAGVYGVLSYAVSRRTSEIGVRLALGATPGGVLRLIVSQGMRPVLAGLVVGVVAALALTRLMTSLLFGITPTDILTYLGVGSLLAGAALFSCLLPARHALRIDVMAALRQE